MFLFHMIIIIVVIYKNTENKTTATTGQPKRSEPRSDIRNVTDSLLGKKIDELLFIICSVCFIH